eukprot:8064688-Pyramimonas_sp.AAC.1
MNGRSRGPCRLPLAIQPCNHREIAANSPPAATNSPPLATYSLGLDTDMVRARKKIRGELNSSVVEWLNKGLMAAWSPKTRPPAGAGQSDLGHEQGDHRAREGSPEPGGRARQGAAGARVAPAWRSCDSYAALV